MIGEKKVVSEKFTTQKFVIETEGQYPQQVEFQASNKNIDDLDKMAEGSVIEFEFELRGRAWENKEGVTSYFNTLNAFKIKPSF